MQVLAQIFHVFFLSGNGDMLHSIVETHSYGMTVGEIVTWTTLPISNR